MNLKNLFGFEPIILKGDAEMVFTIAGATVIALVVLWWLFNWLVLTPWRHVRARELKKNPKATTATIRAAYFVRMAWLFPSLPRMGAARQGEFMKVIGLCIGLALGIFLAENAHGALSAAWDGDGFIENRVLWLVYGMIVCLGVFACFAPAYALNRWGTNKHGRQS